MAKKKHNQPAVNPFLSQAEQYAVIKYGGQVSGLKTLLQNARQEYQRAQKNALEGRDAVQAQLASAEPSIGAAYDQASQRLSNASQIVDTDLAKLGPLVGPSAAITQAIALERQTAADNTAQARAATTADLQNQGVSATKNAQAAITQARGTRDDTKRQILQQATDLAAERGAFITSTAQDLAGADAAATAKAQAEADDRANRLLIAKLNARTSIKNSKRTARTARMKAEAAQIAAGQATDDKYLTKFGMTKDAFLALPEGQRQKLADGATDGGGGNKPKASTEQVGGMQDEIGRALAYARDFKGSGDPRHVAAGALVKGKPAIKAKDKNGNTIVAVPEIPRTDQLAASIALDIAYDGRVSHRNAELLRKRGITLKQLGYRGTPKSAGRPNSPQGKAVTRTAIQGGLTLDRLLRNLGS